MKQGESKASTAMIISLAFLSSSSIYVSERQKISESFVFGISSFFFLEFGVDEMDKHRKFDTM